MALISSAFMLHCIHTTRWQDKVQYLRLYLSVKHKQIYWVYIFRPTILGLLDLKEKREQYPRGLNYLATQSKLDSVCELNHWTGTLPDKYAHFIEHNTFKFTLTCLWVDVYIRPALFHRNLFQEQFYDHFNMRMCFIGHVYTYEEYY